MRTPFRSSPRSQPSSRRRSITAGVTVVALVAALWAAVVALPLDAQGPGALEPAELVERIGDAYEVSDAGGILALRPRASDSNVRLIELDGDQVTINQAEASPEVVRAWLGEDGDLILALAELPVEQRFDLFALRPAAEEPEEADEAEVAEEAPEEPESSDDTVEESRDADSERTREYRRRSEEVSVFGGITVPADVSVREAVAVFGSIHVKGEVRGDVVAVFGSVTIDGRVDGSVTAVLGSVRLSETARVAGDVTSVSGAVRTQEGAVIRGSRFEVGLSDGWDSGWSDYDDSGWHEVGFDETFWALFWEIVWLGLVLILTAIVILVAPQQVHRVAEATPREWLKGGLLGFLVVVTFLPLFVLTCVLLAVSIVGIPVLILLAALSPFWIIVLLLLSFVGYVGVASWVGGLVTRRLGQAEPSLYVNAFVGIVLLGIFSTLGDVLEHVWTLFVLPAWAMQLVGAFIWFVTWVIGIGILLLDFFGRRRRQTAAWQPPAPPAPGAAGAAAGLSAEPAPTWDPEPPPAEDDQWTLESEPLEGEEGPEGPEGPPSDDERSRP